MMCIHYWASTVIKCMPHDTKGQAFKAWHPLPLFKISGVPKEEEKKKLMRQLANWTCLPFYISLLV